MVTSIGVALALAAFAATAVREVLRDRRKRREFDRWIAQTFEQDRRQP